MKLRPYQERAIDFWLKYHNVYLAIDMGLGKTAIALHLVNQLNLPALVVAPLKVSYNTWPDEIEDWDMQGDISVNVLHGPNKLERFRERAQVQVVNYEGLPWLYKQLFNMHKAGKPMPYKILILDESTLYKDPKSNRFGYLSAMRDMFSYIANLSGTPAPQSLLDLWAQYYILDKGKALGESYPQFKTRFFKQDPYRRFHWEIRFGAEAVIHRAIAPSTFRLSSDDHISLPKKILHRIRLGFQAKERKMYDTFKKDFILFLEGASVKSLNKASLSTKLRQFVQGAIYENLDSGDRRTHYLHNTKTTALKHLIEEVHGQNVLVLVQFKFEVTMLAEVFPGVPYITGETKNAEGNEYIRQWKRGELPILLAHPRSVGRGLNLQSGGHIVIWYALPWSLDDYLQTNKRLHRPGQLKTVLIYHLLISGTIDETVYNALTTKGMTQSKLLEYLRQYTMRRHNEK